jgi:cation diffusion facilitator CzcD-associated flavoprotein CzcO
VLVANGHHWDPRWPEPAFPGSFAGTEMHAHHYVDHDIFRDKRVLVVGIGNSAMDIAVESSYVAERTLISSRRSAYVLPKYVFGRPLDQIGAGPLAARVPWAVRQRVLEAIFRLAVGRIEDYGLPQPDHRIGEAHPTVSADFLNRLVHGEMTWKPNIAELQGERVRFADGSVEDVDIIVYCTGYKVSFPFFDEDFVSAPDNDLPLFRRAFHPDHPDLFFLSLVQVIGATMPIAEAQGRWIAAYLRGEYHLPDAGAVRADIERERQAMFKRYVASKRHTMQVDFDSYLYELGRELKAGGERARRAGFALPVPPRAPAGDPVAG